MITITDMMINETPVLIVEEKEAQGKAVPTVIYYHGFYGQKQDSLTIAYNIAANGMRVILPDAYMHGARRGKVTRTEIDLAFWEIVIHNVKEIDEIKEYLINEGLFDPAKQKIGLGGTSMGGITTSAALTLYQWIDCGAVVMGSPNLTDFAHHLINGFNELSKEPIPEHIVEDTLTRLAPMDLSRQPERLEGRPLLFWHGENDLVVPTKLSEDFYLANEADNIRYVKEPGRMHNVSRLAVKETTDWFTEHLLSE